VCRLHEEIELFAQRATPTAKERLAMEAAVEVRAGAPSPRSHVPHETAPPVSSLLLVADVLWGTALVFSARVSARNVCLCKSMLIPKGIPASEPPSFRRGC
jgi:hypothetical protein